MGLCARSRGSAFVRVHGGCVWFHSSRTSDTWPRHTRFVRLSLSPSFFHPLIGTLNPNNGAEKTEKASPSPCARHVAADKLITIRTIDRPLSLWSETTTDSRTGGAITPSSSRPIELSYRAHPIIPHFISPLPLVSLFSCLASRSINRSHL